MTATVTTEDFDRHLQRMKLRTGEERGPLVIEVERGIIVKFARSVGETKPIYLDEQHARTTRFGGIIAPPTFVSYFVTQLTESMYDFDTPGLRSLHTDDVCDNFLPIRVGDLISATARYLEPWIHEGRSRKLLFQSCETTLTNQHGERVAAVRMNVASFV